MNDKSLGSIIFALGLIGTILYVGWLFAPAEPRWLFMCDFLDPPVRWAILLPILLVVMGVFFIAMWIGWTMVVTPPPVLDDIKPVEEDPSFAESP
jgi:hypothetical protein